MGNFESLQSGRDVAPVTAREIVTAAQENNAMLLTLVKAAKKGEVQKALSDLKEGTDARTKVLDAIQTARAALKEDVEASQEEKPETSPEGQLFSFLAEPKKAASRIGEWMKNHAKKLPFVGSIAGAIPWLGSMLSWEKISTSILTAMSALYEPIPLDAVQGQEEHRGILGLFSRSIFRSMLMQPIGLFANKHLLGREIQAVIKKEVEVGEEITIAPIEESDVTLVLQERQKRINLKDPTAQTFLKEKTKKYIEHERRAHPQEWLTLELCITDILSETHTAKAATATVVEEKKEQEKAPGKSGTSDAKEAVAPQAAPAATPATPATATQPATTQATAQSNAA